MLPSITVTDATPQRTSVQPLGGVSTPTSSANTPASTGKSIEPYRLLYRGALSLPDSYLQLDGIAFSARLPNRHISTVQDPGSPSPSCALARDTSARELMNNPLALALESMRGRHTLRFKGTVRLADVWMDDTGDVYMDIHPYATLTRIYFENVLCLGSLVQQDTVPKRTLVGVRVSLGDTDGPETTEIVIYGETRTLLQPPPMERCAVMSTSMGPPPLNVRVARITTAPRAPRPDDPTPRQPPVHVFGTMLSDLGANKRILPRSSTDQNKGKGKGMDSKVEDAVVRRAREVMLHLPRGHVRGGGKARGKNGAGFKVPELPAKISRRQGDGTDVFGAVERPRSPSSVGGKGKDKATDEEGDMATVNAIEDANKRVLKKLTVQYLSDAGVSRSHAEFKDIFGFVYRGATFALRSQMKTFHIGAQAAEAAVEAHVQMYVSAHSPWG